MGRVTELDTALSQARERLWSTNRAIANATDIEEAKKLNVRQGEQTKEVERIFAQLEAAQAETADTAEVVVAKATQADKEVIAVFRKLVTVADKFEAQIAAYNAGYQEFVEASAAAITMFYGNDRLREDVGYGFNARLEAIKEVTRVALTGHAADAAAPTTLAPGAVSDFYPEDGEINPRKWLTLSKRVRQWTGIAWKKN